MLMKKLFALIIAVLFTTIISFAQVPQKMSYQSVIRDGSGNLITSHEVGVRISILQGTTPVYIETHSTSTNANGLVSIEIGNGTFVSGIAFSAIDWSIGVYSIKTETDPAGGTNYTAIDGKSQLLSVPYALYSKVAENGFSGNYDDLKNKPTLFNGNYNSLSNLPSLFDGSWTSLTGKPTFAAVATTGSYNDLSNKPNIPTSQINSDWNSNSGLSQILNKPTLFNGNYNSLSNLPSLFDGSWTSLNGKPTFAAVATTGSYNDLSNKPNIPTSQINSDWNSNSGLNEILNKPTLFNGNYNSLSNLPSLFDGSWTSLTGKPTFAAVATTGSYNDLSNKPNIPTSQINSDWNSNSGLNEILNKPTLFSGAYSDLTGKPVLWDSTWASIKNKPVFFDGQFNSLTSKPTTIEGYSITNAMTTSHPVNAITSTNITNWNTAFGWGNHAGLYRLVSWVPTWTDIASKPTFSTVATSGNYNDLANKPNAGNGISIDGTNKVSINITSQAAGDIMYFNGANWVRLPKGNDGQILTLKSGVPTWQNQLAAPIVTTIVASNIISTGVTLNGIVNGNGLSTIVTFEYGTTTSYGNTTTASQSPVVVNANSNVSATIGGLVIGTTYHFRVNAVNSFGTSYGSDMTFTYLYYGALYQGGLVFYIDGTGQHGLVSAPTDQSTGAAWGCSGTAIPGADGWVIGTGNQNTTDIVTKCGTAGIAARICYDLSLNGYTDWFLPSRDEIDLMNSNLKANGLGSFSSTWYWSSTESGNSYAAVGIFGNPGSGDNTKTSLWYVRASRAF